MFNLFKKKKKEINLVFNNNEIDSICLILHNELERFEQLTTLERKDSDVYLVVKRYYNFLNGKEVAIVPLDSKDREDLLILLALIMRVADKVEDSTEKNWLYSIAARIQWVHRGLGE